MYLTGPANTPNSVPCAVPLYTRQHDQPLLRACNAAPACLLDRAWLAVLAGTLPAGRLAAMRLIVTRESYM